MKKLLVLVALVTTMSVSVPILTTQGKSIWTHCLIIRRQILPKPGQFGLDQMGANNLRPTTYILRITLWMLANIIFIKAGLIQLTYKIAFTDKIIQLRQAVAMKHSLLL